MRSRLVCVLWLAVPLLAQDPRGRILGRVTDSSGAIVPGVQVTATNQATNVAASGVTNEQGNYDIPYLLPGIYQVAAELQGFKKYVRDGLEVRVSDRLSLDIVLEPGVITEAVTVTGQTPLLETSTASIGQVVDNRRLTELPLSGGNPFTLTRLAPGVINFGAPNHPNLGPAVEVVSNIAVSGTRDHNSEYSIDGTPAMWGRNAAMVPPADMVQEYKVQTSTFDASVGHSPGGVINVSLRSGSNALRGSLYNFHNNNVLQGIDFFQRQYLYNPATGPVTEAKRKEVAPQHVINRYGATVAGPLWLPGLYNGRDRSFWTYGFEGLIRPGTERGGYSHTVPTLRQRQSDFSELLALGTRYQVYDPATIQPAAGGRFSRQPLPGNIIPASRLDGMARNLLQYWPEPNTAGSADGRLNYFRPLRSQNEYSSHTVRADHNFSQDHRVFARYSQTHQLFRSGQNFPNLANGNTRHRYNKSGGFDDVYVFNPTLLLNFRYGFSRFIQTFDPLGMGFDLAAAGFSKDLVARLDPAGITFPQIAVDQLAQLGSTYVTGAYTNYHTWAGDLTHTRGNHSLRFGGEYRLFREHALNYNYSTPRLEFGSAYTNGPLDNSPAAPIGQGLASYLFGIPTGGRIDVNASYAEQSTYAALYLQDDWKLTPRLTLNLGLRYEYEGPPTERFNRSVLAFDFSTANPIEARARANYAAAPIPEVPADRFRALGGLTFAGVGGNPRRLWNRDPVSLSPRFGLAYSLHSKTILRAGYGVFFVPLGVDRSTVNQSGYTQRTNLTASNDNGQTFIASLANPFPQGFQQAPGASGGLSTDVGMGVSFFNQRARNGYLQRWSFGLQQELPQRVLLEATYVGSRAVKLAAGRQYNPVPAAYLSRSPVRDQATIDRLTAQVANPFYPLLPGTGLSGRNVARSQLLRPYPHFTGVSATETIGYSWYHSLQTRAERRFQHGFTAQLSYTWSKFMEATDFLNATDAFLEELISDQDRPHRFTFSGIWELPFGPGRPLLSNARGVLAHLAGGWQFQGVYEGQTGAPIGFGNIIFYGNVQDIVLPRDQRTTTRWFNIDAGFERDPARQLAQNIRAFPTRFSGLRSHGLNIWNLSALKNFTIRERFKIQFRTEWLNALNHSHFSGPVTGVTNTLFGSVTATSGFPRQVYFALKVLF
ncbi:MAG: TonB-dependent receptor [Acidobacteria bacterium]|nr:TonB-dependent receptor [Acidobacteriota bacterium]